MTEVIDILDALDHLHATGQRITGPLRWVPHPSDRRRMIIAVPVGPVEPAPAPASSPEPVEGPRPELVEGFRSKTERAWARLFNRLGVEWRYERLEERIAKALRYRPDFWLPQAEVFVEIKGQPPNEGEIRAARELRQATGNRVYLLAGWPEWGRFGVWVFTEEGDFKATRPDVCAMTLCNVLGCGLGELREAMGR